jgi:hypothetical protein
VSQPRPAKAAEAPGPSQKDEAFIQVPTQQATQRETATKWGLDRSTVVHIYICRRAKQGALDALTVAVPGRPGRRENQVGTGCRLGPT